VDQSRGTRATPRTWIDGLRRHAEDLRSDSYEGASGAEREAPYRVAFDFLSIVATGVLGDINELLLRGTGDISIRTPGPDGHGGLIGSWMLSWPALREARSRMTGKAISPVTVSAVWPAGFVHPHLVAGGPVNPRADSLVAWPMQIASAEEAAQQEPLLWAIATAEVHDRIYQSSWRVISGRD
jgi:hypothetical protein